jgi:drug/metabolite transporter (DMT)-like permease
MKFQARFLAWVCAILGFVGVAFIFVGEERYLLPGAILLGSAAIAFALLAMADSNRRFD